MNWFHALFTLARFPSLTFSAHTAPFSGVLVFEVQPSWQRIAPVFCCQLSRARLRWERAQQLSSSTVNLDSSRPLISFRGFVSQLPETYGCIFDTYPSCGP